MNRVKLQYLPLALAVILLSLGAPSIARAAGSSDGAVIIGMQRLTEQQYRNIIGDVFGRNIAIVGRFDPLLRTSGLLAVGAAGARITPSGFEQYYNIAHSVAAQVVSEANRSSLIPCVPKDPQLPDASCASAYLTRLAPLLYRRPAQRDEVQSAVDAASSVASTTHDFYAGMAEGIATMLVSPRFLYVVYTAEPDPKHPGNLSFTAFSRASRLSFLLWNTTPDELLLQAAAHGDLSNPNGVKRQVERMMASPHFEQGVRAFVSDFLGFDKFASLEKDSVIYPAFGPKVAEDAKEQMLLTIVDHLVIQNADYRELFTTRKTFMTGSLARLYRVPVSRPDGGWQPYEFPPSDPHGAGILSDVGFLAAYSHPGISSPTVRGKAIRELLLCQRVPDPPGNVDFSKFNDPKSPHLTARDRLTAHRENPVCAGCHKITDQIGLGLEHFDGAGQARRTENGAKIDTSGNLDGVAYTDEVGLGKALYANPAVTSCVSSRLFEYALGRPLDKNDQPVLKGLQTDFSNDGYRVPRLMERIAESDALYSIAVGKKDEAATTVAAAGPTDGSAAKLVER